MKTTRFSVLLSMSLPLALAGCHGGFDKQPNVLPDFVAGTPRVTNYDGISDDLLSAGLGKTGLASGSAPGFANPASPTPAELRRLAIYSNYRALVDMSAAGGYGRLWGPNIDLQGNDTLGEGRIAGTEYLALADDGSSRQNVSLLVQIPAGFDPANPCIVTATSSGSRGVYGAISAAGEWGLKRGCAVAYTDKGGGNGAHELATNTVTLIDGTLANASAAGRASLFTANVSASDVAAFNAAWPNRYAFKHAHSQQNPEKDWGKFTLEAIQFAYWALNDKFGPAVHTAVRYRPGSITTIAASVSNGAGAALAAAEQDTQGWVSAVVVGEPQINTRMPAGAIVTQGGTGVGSFGRPLYDYMTLANLLEPCAAYASAASGAPLQTLIASSLAQARCAALASGGFVSGADFASQANDALAKLHAAGYQTDSDMLHAAMWATQAVPAVAVTYANAYARASVLDNLCDFSFSPTDTAGAAGLVPAVSPMLTIFGTGNGVPPTDGIDLVYNKGTSGAFDHRVATADASYGGVACLRGLWTGAGANARSVQQGVSQILVNANLHGKPAIIVQGRSDTLVPVNHASRAYLAANSVVEGGASQVVLYEVTNGQHFDAFLSLPGFDTRFVPVHYYDLQALNLMWNHLKSGAPLPPSQVVHTTPRGGSPGAAPALSTANLPSIAAAPGANAIAVLHGAVDVPN